LELKQAEIAYQSLEERHDNVMAVRNVTAAQVANASADVDRFEISPISGRDLFTEENYYQL
jgi:hypothetical protein